MDGNSKSKARGKVVSGQAFAADMVGVTCHAGLDPALRRTMQPRRGQRRNVVLNSRIDVAPTPGETGRRHDVAKLPQIFHAGRDLDLGDGRRCIADLEQCKHLCRPIVCLCLGHQGSRSPIFVFQKPGPGNSPLPARVLSRICSGLEVPGMAQVTVG